MMDASVVQTLVVYLLPVVFAITLHEAAHGYVACRCGDQTAMWLGRVTLNPLKHIDPVGTVLIPLLILLASVLTGTTPFLFGWAKPVPVNFTNLNHPKRDMRYVAFAGPAANLLMVVLWAVLLKLLWTMHVTESFFLEMAKAGVLVNLVFAALNLLPILPLDGGRILLGLLPNSVAYHFSRTEPYGMIILIALVVLNVLPIVIQPFVQTGVGILSFFLSL
jgi:Zn-dependent protease